jgi:hypothetical protein
MGKTDSPNTIENKDVQMNQSDQEKPNQHMAEEVDRKKETNIFGNILQQIQ